MRGRPTFIYSNYEATVGAIWWDSFGASGFCYDILEGCEDVGIKPPNASGTFCIVIDRTRPLPVGAVAILGNYLNGVTLRILACDNTDGSDYAEVSAAAEINSASFNAAYRLFPETTKRYTRLEFTGMGASFEIQHVAVCRAVTLPYLEDGHDPDCFTPTGAHLVGVSGNYLGATQQCAMRDIKLDFGYVTDANYATFQLWAEACIKTMRPFFYVPDIDQPECYFGWVEAKYKFSAPSKLSRHKLAPIPFISRVA